MAHDALAAAQNSLEAVARSLFSGELDAIDVREALMDMHSAVMKVTDDSSIDLDDRRMLLIGFHIFTMTTAFIAGEFELVGKRRNQAVRPYHKGLEDDPDLPLIWWFIGVLNQNRVERFIKVIQSKPSALKSEALFVHRIIAICLDALLDPRPTRP
jgi:hypothetical protein